MVVNVATNWGLTDKNYRQMVQLYEKYSSEGLEILAFPCNQFNNQEPGDEASIKRFASEKYGVKFPMFSKVEVNGTDAHPVFKFLRCHSKELYNEEAKTAGEVPWNFAKWLINSDGRVVSYHTPREDPLTLEPTIQAMLRQWTSKSWAKSISTSQPQGGESIKVWI